MVPPLQTFIDIKLRTSCRGKQPKFLPLVCGLRRPSYLRQRSLENFQQSYCLLLLDCLLNRCQFCRYFSAFLPRLWLVEILNTLSPHLAISFHLLIEGSTRPRGPDLTSATISTMWSTAIAKFRSSHTSAFAMVSWTIVGGWRCSWRILARVVSVISLAELRGLLLFIWSHYSKFIEQFESSAWYFWEES